MTSKCLLKYNNDTKLLSSIKKESNNVQNCLINHRIECNKSFYLNSSINQSLPNNLIKLFKIMLILILILFFLFNNILSNRLDNVNNLNNTFNHNLTIQNSFKKNSSLPNLFYDLSLYNDETNNQLINKKSIYFQFITNKPLSTFNHQIKQSTINYQIYLQRFMLNSTVKCNDGTDIGYYIRKNKHSKKWIIFLEGGWFCYSKFTCHQRWTQMRSFMSSAHWPDKKIVNGILSAKITDNPYYYNVNHIFIPYCSSDGWSGNNPAKTNKDLHFSGSKIIQNVIVDLISKGLNNAELVMLTGSSAGGTGVLINLDNISNLLSSINPKIKTRGIIDSGWFLDNEPFRNINFNNLLAKKLDRICLNGQLCSPIESIKRGFKYWNSQLPDSCMIEYPNEQWRCFFGPRIYRTLKTPIFVIQYLFDEAQMTANNVALPKTKADWHYVYKMSLQIRNSLKNVSGLFAPSCISHTMLTKKNWNQIKINGLTLTETLKCWEMKENFDLNYNDNYNQINFNIRKFNNKIKNDVQPLNSFYLNTYPTLFNFNNDLIFNQIYYNKRKKINKKNKKLRNHDNLFLKESNLNNRCLVRLIDDCTFPQCNPQCPKLVFNIQ